MAANIDYLLNSNGLPYRNKSLVKTKAQELSRHVKTLAPKIGQLIANDGREWNLLVFGGTIPIQYLGQTYNIPVEIFLTESFPDSAPHVFVRPTSNMIVKPGHSFVNPDGDVQLQYLREWNSSATWKCSLVELANHLMRECSREPPLFSVMPPEANPRSTPGSSNTQQQQQSNASPRPSFGQFFGVQQQPPSRPAAQEAYYANATPLDSREAARGLTSATAAINVLPTVEVSVLSPSPAPAYPPRQVPVQSPPSRQPTPSMQPSTASFNSTNINNNSNAKKQYLLTAVTEKIQIELSKRYSELGAEIDEEFETQGVLGEASSHIDNYLFHIKELEKQIADANTSMDLGNKEFSRWMTELEQRFQDEDIEKRLTPFDELSAQIVRLDAENKAIEDAMFYMEKALESASNGTVDAVTLVKSMRKLAKQQFLCKAHLVKIRETLLAANK